MAAFWGRGGRKTRRCGVPGVVTFERIFLVVFFSLIFFVYLKEHRYLLLLSRRNRPSEGSWVSSLGSGLTQTSGQKDLHKSITMRIDAEDQDLANESSDYPDDEFERNRTLDKPQVTGISDYLLLSRRDHTTGNKFVIERAYSYGKENLIQETLGVGVGGQRSSKKRSGVELPGLLSSTTGASPRRTLPGNRARSVKIIELHTPLYENLSWQKHLRGAFDLRRCPETRCKFVFHPDHHPDPDALVFHAPHVRKGGAFPPAPRRSNRTYIVMSLEPTGLHPENGDMARFLEEDGVGDSIFFDWTMTFHRHSDVHLSYGHFRSLKGRELYVRDLSLHLPVDTFGGCGRFSCGSNEGEACYRKVLAPNYKFYLAFEDNMCEDYVSDKPYRALMHGMVPVVFGGANYSHYLPPGSYIDATPLDPEALAQVILEAASTRELYGRFHLWRKFWWVRLFSPLCQLCSKLHKPSLHSSSSSSSVHLHIPHRFHLRSPSPSTSSSGKTDPISQTPFVRNFGVNAVRRHGTTPNVSSVFPVRSSNHPPQGHHPNALSPSSPSEVPPPSGRTLTEVWVWWVGANRCFTLYPEDRISSRSPPTSNLGLQTPVPPGDLLGSFGKRVGGSSG
ncbi:uncharacterized protein LOC143021023 isoform X2 [Oratosquilla oratoria]|uniref:uncharacterized protein LOC143021023 isoform X2 n=1 Tax=Oratosquilla oratoria TaxID=337810 RepID=UPI003F759406